MLKTVIHYPETKELLNFSEEKFKEIYKLFPQIKFIYSNDVNEFADEIVDADFILVKYITTELYYCAKKHF